MLAAEQGNLSAQKNLAGFYEAGLFGGVPKNTEEAIKWYKRAAAQGDAEAKLHLDKLNSGK